jgi:hypothetical protein
VALVVESEASAAAEVEEPASLDASGMADEGALDQDPAGDNPADPRDESTLTPPEVSEDDLEV